MTATADDNTTQNMCYKKNEVEAFLAILWNEIDLNDEIEPLVEQEDEELSDAKAIPNHHPDNNPIDPYNDEHYTGLLFEKEVRYTMILEFVALETIKVNEPPIDNKNDEEPD